MEENIMITAVARDVTPERSLMLYNIAWGPTASLASPDQLQKICGGDQTLLRDGAASAQFYDKIGRAIIASFRQTMRELSTEQLDGYSPHIQKYSWSLRRLMTPMYGYAELDAVDIEELLKEAELDRPGWKLFTTVARSLKRLITSPEGALRVFFQDGLAEMFYSSMYGEVFDNRMRAFLDATTHAQPVRILEVGAGSGSMTSYILSILSNLEELEGRDRFISYTYTDVSPAFFEDGKTRFQPFESRMVYAKLDLATDVSGAEFHAEPYDIIFAGSVLHATSDLTATLTRLHKLLRPGGRLACFELVPSFPWIDVVFGLLPGWWSSKERWRATSPLATEEQWAQLLERTGFSGTDLIFKDNEDDAGHLFTMMISTALPSDPTVVTTLPGPGLLVVVDPGSQAQAVLAEQLLSSCGRGRVVTLDQVADSTVAIPEAVISILEVSSSLLPRISADEFSAFKQLIQRVSRMVWVTSVGIPEERMDSSGMALGLFRTIKTELPEKQIATLVVESDVGSHGALPPASHMVSHISQVLQAAFAADSELRASDAEFVVRGGYLQVGRMVQAPSLSDNVSAWSFDANASYVIAGGLGGLGRSIIQWMVRRGARYLIVLSRSGIAKAAGTDLISNLEELHVTIMAPKCDIASRVAVEAALESCRSVMPPVRGCINAANVLQDSIFENMTHDQWDLTLSTKAEGTWNLHQLLPQDLDFFILLSSLAGVVGSAGQSNYAAGCAYQDSLARYRVAQGQKAVSLDIGWMHKTGIVAETERYARNLESVGDLARVEEEDLLAVLEIYCDPSCPILSPDKSQVLVGVRTAADSLSSGSKPTPQMLRPTFSNFARPRGQHSAPGTKQAVLEKGIVQ